MDEQKAAELAAEERQLWTTVFLGRILSEQLACEHSCDCDTDDEVDDCDDCPVADYPPEEAMAERAASLADYAIAEWRSRFDDSGDDLDPDDVVSLPLAPGQPRELTGLDQNCGCATIQEPQPYARSMCL